MSARTHTWQRGLFAMQIRLPCRMRRRLRPVHSPGRDDAAHVLLDLHRVGRGGEAELPGEARRHACRRQIPAPPNATPSTTLAVLRPTPRSCTRSSMRGGTSPLMEPNEVLAHLANRARFGAKEPRLVNDRFDVPLLGCREVPNRRIARKQRWRHRVDIDVGRLRTEDHRNQQLPGIPEVQFRMRIRIFERKPLHHDRRALPSPRRQPPLAHLRLAGAFGFPLALALVTGLTIPPSPTAAPYREDP